MRSRAGDASSAGGDVVGPTVPRASPGWVAASGDAWYLLTRPTCPFRSNHSMTITNSLAPVAVNDIGSPEEILAAVDETIKYFDDGDIVEGTVVKVDRDEVLLDIGYKTEGVILARELSIKHDVDPDEIVSVGDEIEALVLQKEDKEGRLILSKKRAEYERAWQAYPHVLPCLEELRDHGFEPVVFSNGDDRQQNMKLERIGVREYFSCVCAHRRLLGGRQASSGGIRQGNRGAGFRELGAHLRRRRLRARCAGCARCWLAGVPPGPVRHRLRSGLHQVAERAARAPSLVMRGGNRHSYEHGLDGSGSVVLYGRCTAKFIKSCRPHPQSCRGRCDGHGW